MSQKRAAPDRFRAERARSNENLSDIVFSGPEFSANRKRILPVLRAKDDPPPRLLQHGTGPPQTPFDNVREAVAADPTLRMVRGYRLMRCPYDDGLLWRAQFRVVVARTRVLSDGTTADTYEDVTRAFDGEVRMGDNRYVFVPSSRAHREQSDADLTAGMFHFGCVVGGESVIADALVTHYELHGRRKGVIALTPETCIARRRMLVSLYPHFVEWQEAHEPDEDIDGVAEDLGFMMRPYDPALHPFASSSLEDARRAHMLEKLLTVNRITDAVSRVVADPAAPDSQEEVELCEAEAEALLHNTTVDEHFRILSGVETLRFVLIVERQKALANRKAGGCCAAHARKEEVRAYFEHYSKMHARAKRIVARREEAMHARRGWGTATGGSVAKAF